MKKMTYCPLCGAELVIVDDGSIKTDCETCGAKEYRVLGIPVGYLYPAEYQQFQKLGTIMFGLLVFAVLVWYILHLRISAILPKETAEVLFSWLENSHAAL